MLESDLGFNKILCFILRFHIREVLFLNVLPFFPTCLYINLYRLFMTLLCLNMNTYMKDCITVLSTKIFTMLEKTFQ